MAAISTELSKQNRTENHHSSGANLDIFCSLSSPGHHLRPQHRLFLAGIFSKLSLLLHHLLKSFHYLIMGGQRFLFILFIFYQKQCRFNLKSLTINSLLRGIWSSSYQNLYKWEGFKKICFNGNGTGVHRTAKRAREGKLIFFR